MKTRQKIIVAAEEVISEQGLEAAPISLIAKRAGITDGAIYRHFSSKEELVTAVYHDLIHSFNAAFSINPETEITSKEQFIGFWMRASQYMLANPQRLALFELLNSSGSVPEEHKTNAFEQSQQALTAIFDRAKIENQIREDIEQPLMTLAIFGALSKLTAAMRKKSIKFDEGDVHKILQIFWRGMSHQIKNGEKDI